MRKWLFWFDLLEFFKPVKRFIIIIGLVISAVVIATYLGFYNMHERMTMKSMVDQATSYYDLIIKAREWNAMHAGVYVRKAPGVESNEYLRKLGVEPDIMTDNGEVLTLENPATMTREISALTKKEEGATFRITSLKLVNPDNAPDEFEKGALASFERGAQSAWRVEGTGDAARFRLMKPLRIQEGCLNCHKDYRLGDIRGGISVSLPYGEVERHLKENRIIIILLSGLTMALMMGTLYVTSGRMLTKLHRTQEQLREASITDPLTGIRNRRFIMERLGEEFQQAKRTGSPLAIIMMDIDHFKSVNDNHGHPFGDSVLIRFTELIRSHLRTYDIFGRFGGEEFIVVSPNTSLADAAGLAERLRVIIGSEEFTDGSSEASVTASFGVSAVTGSDASPVPLLARADDALYRAKQAGRDRVES